MFVSPVLSLSPTLEKRVYSARSATFLPTRQAVPIPIIGSTELADWESLPPRLSTVISAVNVTFEKMSPKRP